MRRREAVLLVVAVALAMAIPAASQDGAPGEPGSRLSVKWVRCGGPLGGLGYDVRMHPSNQDTMLVTDSFGGAFRSEDGGLTWVPSSEGITARGGTSGDAIKVFCLTIDQNHPSVVWCGLQDHRGIYKSTNNGRSWTELVNGIADTAGLSIRGITVDPEDSDIVYAAGELSSDAWSGMKLNGIEFDLAMGVVFKTTDGGEEWAEVWRDSSLARYVWIDPRDTDVLYLSTGIFDRESANTDTASSHAGGLGVFKSTDGGLSWNQKNNGLTNLYVGSLFMHPEDPDILLAGCDNGSWPDSGGVFLTTDGADSWTRVLAANVQSVEFALSDPQIAYAGSPESVYRSSDGGNSWVEMTPAGDSWGPPGIVAGFPIDFQVDPDDPDRLFTNNYGGGNFVSTDGGHTWTVASFGYTGAHVRDVAVAPYDPSRVYAAARSGLFRSDDWGTDWSGLTYAPAGGLEWSIVSISPHDPMHVLATNEWMRTIFESHDGGDTWRDAGGDLPDDRGWRCFTFAPSDSQIIYGGSGAASYNAGELPGAGIRKSPDGGQTWIPANDGNSHYANVADLAVELEDPYVVYAASTNVGMLKTRDGGATWTVRNDSLPPEPRILSVAIDPADSTHILAGLDDAGLYESFDGALSWQAVAVGLPPEADVTSIVYSPVDPDLVFIGDLRSGVYRSTDGGAIWTTFDSGLRTRAVNDLAFSADGESLYAGTEGEGVYRLDAAGTGIADDGVELGSAARLHQSRANPSDGSALISFTLPRTTRVSLRIFDVSGRLVRTLLDESRGEGEHNVTWNGQDAEGRAVASGVYLYRLEAAGSTQSKRMVLVR